MSPTIQRRAAADQSATASTAQGPTESRIKGELAEQVLLVRIVEKNLDKFPEPLGLLEDTAVNPPWTVAGGKVRLNPSAAMTVDPLVLREHNLDLGKADVPLAHCGVLVARCIGYHGRGRYAQRLGYYAFERLPAEVPLAPPVLDDRFEYDRARSCDPFPLAIEQIRILGEHKDGIVVAADDNGRLAVQWGGKKHVLASGQAVTLFKGVRKIHVLEKALPRSAVRVEGPPVELPDPVFPAQDHGTIEFRTELTVRFVGQLKVGADADREDQER